MTRRIAVDAQRESDESARWRVQVESEEVVHRARLYDAVHESISAHSKTVAAGKSAARQTQLQRQKRRVRAEAAEKAGLVEAHLRASCSVDAAYAAAFAARDAYLAELKKTQEGENR
jgi:hypothetical protein